MDVFLYKLSFKAPVHFGDTGIDLENVREVVSSDTVFSAIINTISIYYGSTEVREIVDRFLNDPPFVLTSLFVYYKDLYFLPKPMIDTFISDEIKRSKGKDLKKLQWLERGDFLKWQRQNITTEEIDEMLKKQSKYKEAFIKEIKPRVALDRITQQSSLYHCGYIYFKKDAGLYGLVAFKDKNFIEKFKEILFLLGQTGIGGEKAYGCGMFEASFEPVDNVFLDILNTFTDSYTLLSLYHPATDEKQDIEERLLFYDIIRKKGWIVTGRNTLPLKRRSVGFITEGSTLKVPVKGSLVDVTPDSPPAVFLSHKIYRYGYAFTAPFGEAIK